MSSRVFSAKRKSIKFEYEFLDGKKIEVEFKQPTTKMAEELNNIENIKSEISKYKDILKNSLVCSEAKDVEALINEVYENSNLIEFYFELLETIKSEYGKKQEDLESI